eukprot:12328962-Ditylum_brightwellii.AAC.2
MEISFSLEHIKADASRYVWTNLIRMGEELVGLVLPLLPEMVVFPSCSQAVRAVSADIIALLPLSR